MEKTSTKRPMFYDITLRDGNQALKQPWNLKQKKRIFDALVELGVDAIEVGFAAASDVDFDCVSHLAQIAPSNVIVSTLARCNEYDINKAYEALKNATKPRVHTFIGLSPFAMEFVLKKTPQEVQAKALEMVAYAKNLLGDKGEVQFSAEHFGDSLDNLDFVIETFDKLIDAGATIINLPNTVERYRTMVFVGMVEKVVKAIGGRAVVSVHNHNDLGQATASTVESYFVGALQLETSLNGLGERAGNTSLYEVAVSLYNCGVETRINYSKIYETALLVEELSGVKIPDKAPLIGAEALAHRSGIHQDGTLKTKNMKKGAYRPIDPAFIGRGTGELLEFTSQSGRSAVFEVIQMNGLPVTIEEATQLQPILKKMAEERGVLKPDEIVEEYLKTFFNIEGPYKLLNFRELVTSGNYHKYSVDILYKDEVIRQECEGDGPIDAIVNLFKSRGYNFNLLDYEQRAFDAKEKGASARAITIIKIMDKNNNREIKGKGIDFDTRNANLKAVISALNLFDGQG